jgi:gluconokinase
MQPDTLQGYAIGIDIGTSSTKAVAINDSGAVIAASQFYYPTFNPQPGYSEQDPSLLWDAFVQSIQKIIGSLHQPPALITLSSCMHSLVVMDINNKAITALITWADTRSEIIAGELRRRPDAESIYRATGTPIHAMSPLCKIIWLRENLPGVFTNASKFISIKEYIWNRLFNVYETDHSIASATGLFNINDLNWNTPSLNLCNITEDKLSKPVPTDFTRDQLTPSAAKVLNLPAGTPFVIGASDGCLAVVGSEACQPGIASLTVGTSGAVRLASRFPVFNFPGMTFNYLLDSKTFICGGPVNNGGNVIEWLLKSFIGNTKPDEIAYKNIFTTIETVSPGSDGLLFLPYIYGERSPLWDEQACGVYFGIRSHHTKAHFIRAAVEGVCFALLHVLEQVQSAGFVEQINVSGGIIHQEPWLRVLANTTGKIVFINQPEDASAIGAALFGMKAMNYINNYFSLHGKTASIIEPDISNHELYQKYYSLYKELSVSLTGPMHQLYNINH